MGGMPNPQNFPPALVDCHPLLRRLSGQVIWCMFEEYEADPADIDAFLQWYEARRAEALSLIARVQDPVPSGDIAALRIDVQNTPNTCDFCAALSGKYIDASDPDLPNLMPPYGLGCAARAVAVTPEDAAALDPADRITGEITPPCNLLCGDWIFTHPWSTRGLADE